MTTKPDPLADPMHGVRFEAYQFTKTTWNVTSVFRDSNISSGVASGLSESDARDLAALLNGAAGMREALEFYANRSSYVRPMSAITCEMADFSRVSADCGDAAREALAAVKGTK